MARSRSCASGSANRLFFRDPLAIPSFRTSNSLFREHQFPVLVERIPCFPFREFQRKPLDPRRITNGCAANRGEKSIVFRVNFPVSREIGPVRFAPDASTRTAAVRECGYGSGTKRRVRRQATGIGFIDESGGPGGAEGATPLDDLGRRRAVHMDRSGCRFEAPHSGGSNRG